jgi:hypothetical protein
MDDPESKVFAADADCNGYDDIGVVDTRFWGTENELRVYFHFNEPDSLGASCDTMVIPSERSSSIYVSNLNGDEYDDLCYFPARDSIGILLNLGPVATLLASSSFEYHSTGCAQVEWELSCRSCGISGFQIFRQCDDSGDELVVSIPYTSGQDRYQYSEDVSDFRGTTIYYTVFAVDNEGSRTNLAEGHIEVPRAGMRLFPNYPNPFNPGTRVAFELTSSGGVAAMIQGREYPGGRHEIGWDGKGLDGSILPSGVYYCRLKAGKETLTQKMLILR